MILRSSVVSLVWPLQAQKTSLPMLGALLPHLHENYREVNVPSHSHQAWINLNGFSSTFCRLISSQSVLTNAMMFLQRRNGTICSQAMLKGTDLRGWTQICGFLRFSASSFWRKVCCFLRPHSALPLTKTVRAEIITELILARAGPEIFMNLLLDLIAFRLIPVIWPARRAMPENYWKRQLIPDRSSPQ